MPHTDFEWDPAKNLANRRKHAVSFENAARVLADPYAALFHLTKVADTFEPRWITLGSDPYDRQIVLYIVWTTRENASQSVTRIISARPATRLERQDYEAQIYPA